MSEVNKKVIITLESNPYAMDLLRPLRRGRIFVFQMPNMELKFTNVCEFNQSNVMLIAN
jgi:hypothetical protein